MAGDASRRNGKKGGRPKHQATLTKEAAREFVRQRVIAELGPLVDAQIENAKGLKYLVSRDKKTGKFLRVGPAMASATQEETIEVWEKDPAIQAFTDLLNRTIDKPADHVEVTGKDEGPIAFKWQE